MARYPAFVDGEAGAYGVMFPDLPGIVAMGETMDDALIHAEEALRDYVTETERDGGRIVEESPMEQVSPPEGSVLVAVPLIRLSGRTVRANLTLDEGVVGFMDSEARRRGMTRKAFVEWMPAALRSRAADLQPRPGCCSGFRSGVEKTGGCPHFAR